MVKKLKIGAIIQARLGSTRLPNKVLLDLPFGSGTSMLERIIQRAEAANVFNQILVATTSAKSDDPIAALLETKNLPFFRGDEQNVLDRFYQAAKENELDIIVRLTADNPCIDPASLKETVFYHLEQKNDYTRSAGLPLGMNVEVFSFEALKKAHTAATRPEELEHVTAYFYTHPETFKIGTYRFEFKEENFSRFRVTVDYPADFALVNLLFSHFRQDPSFSGTQLFQFWKANNWLGEINKESFQKKVYPDLQTEKAEALKMLQFYGFENAAKKLEEFDR